MPTKIKNLFHILTKNGRTIAIYMLLLLITKQFVIYKVHYEQFVWLSFSQAFYNYMWFLASDFMIFSIVLVLIIINFSTKAKLIKIFFNILNILIITFFFVDIIVMYYFQSKLSLFDLYTFVIYSDSSSFNSYMIPIVGIFISLFLVIYFIVQNYIKELAKLKIFVYFFIFSITLWLLSLMNYYMFNNTFDENIFTMNFNKIFKKNPESSFITNTVHEKYEDYFQSITWLNKKPNIILIFAESFSVIDSKRVWWINDKFPNFDKIQAAGMTMTNFIANWYTSDTSHVAVLKWVEPWNTPNQANNTFYNIYKNYTDTLPDFLNKHWYNTLFLSSVTLDFFDQKKFLSSMNFKKIIWEEAFTWEKKYVFDAAPDHILYKKAITIIKEYESGNTKPFFLTLQTISSHKPYNSPYWNTFDTSLKYSDESIYWFYQNLKATNFFDNWLLIIVADHRKMEPIEQKEIEKFGLNANGRWLATIIWTWIPANSFQENIIQHIDIFYSIKYLVWWTGTVVSSLFNNMLTNETRRDRWLMYCHFCPFKKFITINKNLQSTQYKSLEELYSWSPSIANYVKSFYIFQSQTWANSHL